MFLIIFAVLLLMWRKPVSLSIAALDVGQGDSIVLRSGTGVYLIDGGSSSEKAGRNLSYPAISEKSGNTNVDRHYCNAPG